MKTIRLFIITLLLFEMTFGTVAYSADAFIKKVVVTNPDENIVVYFDLVGAFTDSIVEAIENGIPTTFTFFIKLNSVNKLWFDSSISSLKIYRTIKYDSLKKQYIITEKKNSEKEEELKRTNSLSEAKKTMNEFKSISVLDAKRLKKGNKYQVRIKAELDKVKLPFYLEYVLFFVSVWDFETPWHIETFEY